MKKLFTLIMALTLTSMVHGAETPPCKLTFTSQESFDRWKWVDANNDGGSYLFKYNSSEQAAYYKQNTGKAADDWLISPAITLTAGKQYTVTVSVKNYSTYSTDANDFTVSYGQTQTVEAMATEIMNEPGIKKGDYADKSSETFTVDATGDYYFGIHLTSESFQGDFGIRAFTVAEFVELPDVVSSASVSPAPLGEMKAGLSWRYPSKSSIGGSLTSLTGVRIYREYLYKTFELDDEHLIATVTEGAAPGGAGSYTDGSFSEGSGTYYYAIVPFNENGASLATPELVSAWIGEETDLKKVENLKAEPDADKDGQVLLSWTTPPQGANGAYVNPEKISYRIERGNDVLEESWTGELPYRDTTVPGAGSYTYTVYALYNGKASLYSSKASITIKGVVPLPYANTFDDRTSVEFLTFVHSAPGKNDWSFSSQAIKVYEKGTANAYAYLPPFMLEGDKTYGVSFSTKLSAASSKNLAVVYAKEATADGTHTEVFREVITSIDYVKKTAVFTVPADGKYFVGFLFDGSSTDYKDLYVDNVTVTEIQPAPAAVSELIATVGAEGALEATLTWVNPSTFNTGSALSALSKVVVSRDGTEIKTIEAPTPGSQSSFTDTDIAMPGFYTYSITPYLNENAGKNADVTTAWVGFDTPKAPASVSVSNGSEGRTVSFELVTESVNGGYMPAELTYTIRRNGDLLAEGVTTSPYTDTKSDLQLGFYTYSVAAGYADITGAASSSEPIRLGEVLNLPYSPVFTDEKTFGLWELDKGQSKNDWGLDTQWYNGLAIYGGFKSWAYTPPFYAAQGECLLTFKGACQSTTAEKLTVCLVKEAEETEESAGRTVRAAAAMSWEPEVVGTATDYTIDEPWSGTEFTPRTLKIDIPADGKYHVGFGVNTAGTSASSGRFVLKQSDIVQTVATGVYGIAAAKAGFSYNGALKALVSTTEGRIAVYSLAGTLLLADSGTTLSVERLGEGMYIARLTCADGSTATLKFVR